MILRLLTFFVLYGATWIVIDPFLCYFTILYSPLRLITNVLSIALGHTSVAQSPFSCSCG